MRASLRQKVIHICQQKIAQKGENVGVSFYAFFANKNDDPELLMEPLPGGSRPTNWITLRRPAKFCKWCKPGNNLSG